LPDVIYALDWWLSTVVTSLGRSMKLLYARPG